MNINEQTVFRNLNSTSCESKRSSAYSEDLRWRIVYQREGPGWDGPKELCRQAPETDSHAPRAPSCSLVASSPGSLLPHVLRREPGDEASSLANKANHTVAVSSNSPSKYYLD